MDQEAKKKAGITVKPEPEISPEVEQLIQEDIQFWDFRYDIIPDEEGDMSRWKYNYLHTHEIFDWLPWGKKGHFHEVQVSSIQWMGSDNFHQMMDEP